VGKTQQIANSYGRRPNCIFKMPKFTLYKKANLEHKDVGKKEGI